MPNYSGTWALPAQMQAIGSGNWPVNGPFTYIEDVFSTYLYTGNDSTQTITNGIDLSTKGGLVWIKDRTTANNNVFTDTARGNTKILYSNSTTAELTTSNGIQSFNTNGFGIGPAGAINTISDNFVSWTFAKQAKFFDVVTYTGNGSVQNIAHSLGSAPGCVIVKCTSAGSTGWAVYHRMLNGGTNPANYLMLLQSTSAQFASSTVWNNTAPTSTQFTVGTDLSTNGATYVAYLFAHDAGGFGSTFSDNVISCGSFTANSSGIGSVTLGYEPQWVLMKGSTTADDSWVIFDSMRGMTADKTASYLFPNLSNAESANGTNSFAPNATGFTTGANETAANQTYIYIAIRRPMKPPTTGTEVFSPITSSQPAGTQNTTNFPVDMQIMKYRPSASGDNWTVDRLRGINTQTVNANAQYVLTNSTGAEAAASTITRYWTNPGFQTAGSWPNISMIYWNFKRASTFFDVVCWTGTGSVTAQAHNLTVVPELVIVKRRDASSNWNTAFNVTTTSQSAIILNGTDASYGTFDFTPGNWILAGTPTSTTITIGSESAWNASGGTYVAYLFATCAGVSKVGSYTGTGTTKQVDCGFTGGARFVLIKRTDSTGDWYVWDSARGIVAGNDPYLLLNSTAAEVTGTDYVDTYAAGFEITSTAPAAINANGGSFIFLAIA